MSMAMAHNTLIKVAIDTWDWGPNIYHMPTLQVPSIYFLVSGKMVPEKWQAETYPILGIPWFSHPRVRTHEDLAYSR